jgi:oligopeptide transport system permease protein
MATTANRTGMQQSATPDSVNAVPRGVSLWQDAWSRLCKNRLAMFGLLFLALIMLLCLLAPWLTPYSYEEQNLRLGAQTPSFSHLLGTDTFGRDMLTRILYGGRLSLAVGFIATAVALVIGVAWGAVAGYLGGRVDALMMRLVDILYALPFMIFIVLLMVVFGRNLLLLFLAIGAVEWLTMARIVRGQIQSLRQQEYVEAAHSLGLGTAAIIWRHLIPNALGPVIVYTTLTIPNVMLLEAFLSFLGLGVQPPASSWGLLISSGVETMEEYPWLLIFPGMALTLTLFALNFLGDGLRDALDPRTSKD